MLSLTRYNENADALSGKPLSGSFTLYDLNGKLWTEQSLKEGSNQRMVFRLWTLFARNAYPFGVEE